MRLDNGQIEVVDDIMVPILRQKTPAERLQIAFDLWEMARGIIEASLRAEHPDWGETRIGREVARRLAGEAV